MIPAEIDAVAILNELNRWGWRDHKIEMACAFSVGYIAQVRCGNVKRMSYLYAARLHNFHESEAEIASRGALHTQLASSTA